MTEQNKYYVTFGQVHVHSVAGKTFDKDCVAIIRGEDKEKAREKAFEIFGDKFCFLYSKAPDMTYFPRGFLRI